MSSRQADELAPAVRAAVFRSGRAVIAGTRVDGESWLKVTLLNPAATLEGLTDVVEEIRRTACALENGAAQEAS
jgi:L-2,4-diaminobutyrate decarboxylase